MKRDFALIKHSHALGELLDVDLTGAVDNSLIQYDSASGEWQDVSLASLNSQLDHGLLLGLADDDHTQYVLRSILTTNGDLFTRTAGVIARLGVGSGSNVLGISGGLPAWRTLAAADISDFNEAAQDTISGALTDSSSIDFTYNDGANTITAATINANPTASVGLTAVNGSAATPMRSDGAPALSQAISPTMTGNWTFTPASGNTIFHAGNVLLNLNNQEIQIGSAQDFRVSFDGTNVIQRFDAGELVMGGGIFGDVGFRVNVIGNAQLRNTGPRLDFFETDQAADARLWGFGASGAIYRIRAISDDGSTTRDVLAATRTAGSTAITDVSLGNATNNPTFNMLGTGLVTIGGSLRINAQGQTTGTATAAMTATNKPGANNKTQPDTWMPLSLNGTTYYVPGYLA